MEGKIQGKRADVKDERHKKPKHGGKHVESLATLKRCDFIKLRDSGTTTKYSKWHFPAEKSVDFPPWGLLTFPGSPVICAVKRRFPHQESGKIIAESCSGLFV